MTAPPQGRWAPALWVPDEVTAPPKGRGPGAVGARLGFPASPPTHPTSSLLRVVYATTLVGPGACGAVLLGAGACGAAPLCFFERS